MECPNERLAAPAQRIETHDEVPLPEIEKRHAVRLDASFHAKREHAPDEVAPQVDDRDRVAAFEVLSQKVENEVRLVMFLNAIVIRHLFMSVDLAMDLKPYYELSRKSGQAQSVLKACLDELNWGVVVSLGPEGKPGFDLAATFTSGNLQFKVTSVWVEDPASIVDLIKGLQNGGAVNFGSNGHRMVSINKRDQVSRCLSRLESESPIDVIGAVWCAARSDRACDY